MKNLWKKFQRRWLEWRLERTLYDMGVCPRHLVRMVWHWGPPRLSGGRWDCPSCEGEKKDQAAAAAAMRDAARNELIAALQQIRSKETR
jgi:hypothetical protein